MKSPCVVGCRVHAISDSVQMASANDEIPVRRGRFMKIVISRRGGRDEVDVPENASPMDVLKELGLLPDAHIVLRDGVPIPIDERLNDGDVLKVIVVASGG